MNFLINTFFKKIVANKKINFISRKNFTFLGIVFVLVFILAPSNQLKWIGLTLAMFSTITNDSVQTLGTFMTSNSKTAWWKMWLYISSLFLIVTLSGWYFNIHQLDFTRLTRVPYTQENTIFHFLAPLLLVILTYNKISVSTTFLILSVFASEATMGAILFKTLSGYVVGFIFNYILWDILLRYFSKSLLTNVDKTKKWVLIEWASTGLVWSCWLTQNTSNIVVYLPRSFPIYSLILFLILGITVIAFTFYNKGGPIQEIVSEKTEMTNKKYTSIVNLSFAFIILFIGNMNKVPMATTWIFIGTLAGREVAMARLESGGIITTTEKYKRARKFILKDLTLAGIGILISLIFVYISNNDSICNKFPTF